MCEVHTLTSHLPKRPNYKRVTIKIILIISYSNKKINIELITWQHMYTLVFTLHCTAHTNDKLY